MAIDKAIDYVEQDGFKKQLKLIINIVFVIGIKVNLYINVFNLLLI